MKTTKTCECCNGSGQVTIDVCISEWNPPQHHERFDAMFEIVKDAQRAVRNHATLCKLNPKTKESYDAQLAATLAKLESEAKNLL